MAIAAPWWETVHQRFKANGVRLVVHVPDAALVGLIGACQADPDIGVLQCTREE
jgi:sulfopyruvate decarboxylase TPP-binding subunit